MSYTYRAPIDVAAQAFIVRDSDGAAIPLDLKNMDYQAFLAWVAEGNPAPEGWTGPQNPVPT